MQFLEEKLCNSSDAAGKLLILDGVGSGAAVRIREEMFYVEQFGLGAKGETGVGVIVAGSRNCSTWNNLDELEMFHVEQIQSLQNVPRGTFSCVHIVPRGTITFPAKFGAGATICQILPLTCVDTSKRSHTLPLK
jgi:hypothetical protein